jgi:hypothetical protein
MLETAQEFGMRMCVAGDVVLSIEQDEKVWEGPTALPYAVGAEEVLYGFSPKSVAGAPG